MLFIYSFIYLLAKHYSRCWDTEMNKTNKNSHTSVVYILTEERKMKPEN